MSHTSADLSRHSELCLLRAHADLRGPWLRATPIVLRQALEDAVTQRLQRDQVDPEASMRAKLLCLSEVSEAGVGTEATWLWSRLSDGCHYRAYELDPTLDDLTEWTARTATLVAALMPPETAGLGQLAGADLAQG